jgi:hypothetical protein
MKEAKFEDGLSDIVASQLGQISQKDAESIIEEMTNEGVTPQMADKELSEFVFSRQNKELFFSGEEFFAFFCNLYVKDETKCNELLTELGNSIGGEFVQDLTNSLSVIVKTRQDTRSKEVINPRKNPSTQVIKILLILKSFVGKHDDAFYYASYRPESDLGKRVKELWNNLKVCFLKVQLLTEIRGDRMRKLSVYLMGTEKFEDKKKKILDSISPKKSIFEQFFGKEFDSL